MPPTHTALALTVRFWEENQAVVGPKQTVN